MRRILTVILTALLMVFAVNQMWAAAPTNQAKYVAFSSVSSSSATISWLNGNGNGRIVLLKAGGDPTVPNFDGGGGVTDLLNNYTWVADNDLTVYSGNTMPEDAANRVIYKGTGATRTVNVTGLAAATTYHIMVIEYNNNGVVIDINTAAGTMNPRSFTTTASVNAPITPTATVAGPIINMGWSWGTGHTNATEYDISIFDNGTNTEIAGYNTVDIGTLTNVNPEVFQAYIGTTGTYYFKVRARQSGGTSAWLTSSTFTVTDVTAPQFVQSVTTMTSGQMYVDVVFNKEVTPTADGVAGSLVLADFAIYDFTPNPTGTATGVAIESVTKQNATTYRLLLQISGRATGAETFKVSAADNYSIFGLNGMPIDPADPANYQKTAPIFLNVTNVLNSTDNLSFVTINQAVDASTTGAAETIALYGTQAPTADVTINDAGLIINGSGTLNLANYNLIFTTAGTYSVYSTNSTGGGFVANGGAVTVTGTTYISYDGTTNPLFRSNLVSPVFNITSNSSIRLTSSSTAQYLIDNGSQALGAFTFTGNNVYANYDNSVALNFTVANATTDFDVAFAITGNTFGSTLYGTKGDAIRFVDPAGVQANDMSGATVTASGNTFNNTGYAFAFSGNDQLATAMPIIALAHTNTYDFTGTPGTDANRGVTNKFVYSHSTLTLSDFLYPGIAVLGIEDASTLIAGTAVAYNTVADAIAASADDGSESVFLGQGTYADAIALNEAVNLVGKGKVAATGTTISGVVTASGVTAGYDITDILFDAVTTNSLVVSLTPDGAEILLIDNCAFNYQDGDVALNFTDPTIGGIITLTGNTFTKTSGTAVGTAIGLTNNQILAAGVLNIGVNAATDNTFDVTGGATNGRGIYISSTNTTGVSGAGDLFIRNNTFTLDGNSIVFSDLNTNANNLNAVDISIDENSFAQTGTGNYGIKILEDNTVTGSIYTTLPTIDLYVANVNTNFTSDDIYGGAWFTLAAAAATDLLYPSLGTAQAATAGVTTLSIGAGTYAEDVTFNDAQLVTITGYGTTCEIASGNTATLVQPTTITRTSATVGTFYSPTVILNNAAALLTDAITLVKTSGTIRLPNGITATGDADLNKTGVTLTRASGDLGIGGTILGTLTLSVDNCTVNYLNFTDPDNSISLNPATAPLAGTIIANNTFATSAAAGKAILTSEEVFNGITINNNTFDMGAATSQNFGIYLDNAQFNGNTNIYNNTFNMEGGTAATAAGSDYGIWIEASNDVAASSGTLNVYGNTFTSGGAATVAHGTIAVGFRNSDATPLFKSHNAINIYNLNVINNDGYSFYLVNENSICTYLPATIDLYGTNSNTYTIGANNLQTNPPTSDHYRGFNYVADLTATSAVLTPSCGAPAAFTTGAVVTTTNVVAGYWNSDNTAITVTVPIANDAALLYGYVQIQASRDNFVTPLTLGSVSQITAINANKDMSFAAGTFEGLAAFADGDIWKFRAIITNYAGDATTGTASATTITVDQTAPTATFVNLYSTANVVQPTTPQILSKSERDAGFHIRVSANQANTTIYAVNTTDYTPTFSNIASVSLASVSAPTTPAPADNYNIVINTQPLKDALIHGKTYKAFAKDVAGNLSAASAASFVTDLSAPFAPSSVAELTTTKLAGGGLNKAEELAGFTVRVTLGTSGGAGEVAAVAGDVVELLIGGVSFGVAKTAILGAGDITNGYVDFAIATGNLGTSGSKSLTAKVTDANTNASNPSSALTFTMDIVDPVFTYAFINNATGNGNGYVNNANKATSSLRLLKTATPANNTAETFTYSITSSGGGAAVTSGSPVATGSNTTVTVNPVDLTGLGDGTLSVSVTMTDAVGNTLTIANAANFGAAVAPLLADPIKDVVAPAAFTTGTVVVTGGTVVGNYWNSTNTAITVTIPTAGGSALTGGTAQVFVSKDNWGTSANLGTLLSPLTGAATHAYPITEAQFEALTGFADATAWKFNTVLTDAAGNSTTGTASATTITVDYTAPTQNAPTNTATGGTVVATYYNGTNTGFNIVVPLANDATLVGGNFKIQYRTADNSTFTSNFSAWADVAAIATHTPILIGEINTNITKSLTSVQFEALVAEGQYIQFRVVTTDASTLTATSTGSVGTLRDETAPTISTITSSTVDGNYGLADAINYTVTLNEAAVLTVTPVTGIVELTLGLTTGTTKALRTSDNASSTTLSLTYTVASGDSKEDLSYTINTLALTNTTWRDAAGNNVVLTTPDPAIFSTARAINVNAIIPTFTIQYYNGSVEGPALAGDYPLLKVSEDFWMKISSSKQLYTNPTITITNVPGNNVTNAATLHHLGNDYSYNRKVYISSDNGVHEIITITATDMYGNTYTLTPSNAWCGQVGLGSCVAPGGTSTETAAGNRQGRIDGVKPTPDVTFTPVTPTNASPVLVTIDFLESVQNFTEAMLTITNGTMQGGAFVSANSGTGVFTFNVVPTANGTVTVTTIAGDNINQITDAAGNYALSGTGNFLYDNVKPTVTITGADANWHTANVTVTLTGADAAPASGVKKLYYTTTGVDPTTGSTSYTGTTTPLTISAEGTTTVKLIAEDNAGNVTLTANQATASVKIDKIAPTIAAGTITAPATGNTWLSGSHNILWTAGNITDATSGVKANSVKLEFSSDGGTSWSNIATGLANSGTYAWTIPNTINSTTCLVRISAEDNAGNIATPQNSGQFTIVPATYVATPLTNLVACGSVNSNFTAVYAGGIPPYTFNWEYSADGSSWSAVVNGTPANSSYVITSSGGQTTLNVTGSLANGVYYYKVTVNGISTQATLTVSTAPTAPTSISSNQNNFCTGAYANITLTAVGGSGTTLRWSNDNFATSLGTGNGLVIAAPTTNTTYYARYENACGNSSTTTTLVTVYSLPAAPTASNQTFCTSSNPKVSNLLPNGAEYYWYAESADVVALAPNTSLVDGEDYFVSTVNGNGCESPKTGITVTFVAGFTPTVAITSNDVDNIFCLGTNVTFTASTTNTGGGTVAYQWKVNGSNVGTNSNTYATTALVNNDAVTCEITITGGTCLNSTTATSNSINNTVNPLPTATISAGGPTTFCTGGSVVLTASAGSSWLWSNGATTQAITVSATGNYTVTVTNANGCSATSAATTVTVNPLPTATISAGGPTTFCTGGNVVLTASAGSSWLWSNGATTQAITVSSTGNYTVTVTNANGCSATSTATTVTVNPLPTATISAGGPTTFCTGGNVVLTASAGSSWLWSTGATTQAITVSSTGNYTVTVTNANGCSATSTATTVTVNALPTPTITGNSTVLTNTALALSTGSFSSYTWTATGATITGATSQNATFTWTTIGTKTVNLTVTNANGCSNVTSHTVEVTSGGVGPTKLVITEINGSAPSGDIIIDRGDDFTITVQTQNAAGTPTAPTSNLSVSFAAINGDPAGIALGGTTTGTILTTEHTKTFTIASITDAAGNGGEFDVQVSGGSLTSDSEQMYYLATEPTSSQQSKSLMFTGTTSTQTTVSWSATQSGNANYGRLLILRENSNELLSSQIPVDGNTYSTNASYGAGYDFGNDAYAMYEVNAGTQNVTTTNITPGAEVHFRMFEYRWNPNVPQSKNYRVQIATLNPRTFTMPTKDGVDAGIELANFNAKSYEGIVSLNWATNFENGIAGFELYRVNTNRDEDFSLVSSYMNNNNLESANRASTYKTIDNNNLVVGDEYIYKLTAVTFEGTRVDLAEQNVVVNTMPNAETELYVEQITPNPVRNQLNVNFQLAKSTEVTIEIRDMSGRLIGTVANAREFGAGKHNVQFNMTGNAAGSYIITVSAGMEAAMQSFIYMP